MPKKRARPATLKVSPARGTGPQGRIARQLLDANRTREQLAGQLPDLTSQAISQALWYMKRAERAEHLDGDVWKLTTAGREWVHGITGSEPPKPSAPAGRALRVATNAGAPVPAAVHLVEPHTFRCSVASDGSFWLEKDGHRIDLNVTETRRMVRYLDRMATDDNAAAAA